MYESFFGLACEPFSVAPDPRFLYLSEQHRLALQHLNHGLRHGGGFVLLTGEIGAGKTTVLRHFLGGLPGHFDVALVVNPKLKVDALLARVCEDLHVPEVEAGSLLDPIDALHGHLMLCYAQGRRALIVVDEAQALSHAVFEQLRLITNLVVTSERKLVQVLLVGQPELRQMLTEPALEPLAQRVVARFHLPALPAQETARYIAHRLGVAGRTDGKLFEPDAIGRVHALCRGVPRRINVLCDRALVLAQARGLHTVDGDVVEQAAEDVFGPRLPTTERPEPADGGHRDAVPSALPAAPSAPARAPAPLPARTAAPPTMPHPAAAGHRMPTPAPPARSSIGRYLAAAMLLCGALGFGSWWTAGRPQPLELARAATTAVKSAMPTAGPTASSPAPEPNASPAAMTDASPVSAPSSPASAARASVRGEEAPSPGADEAVGGTLATRPAAPAEPSATKTLAPAVTDLAAVFAMPRSEASAWRELAALWRVDLPAGDVCESAALQGLQCHRGVGGLAPIRQLGRPGVLRVNDGQGRSVPVLLTGLDDGHAVLRYAGGDHRVPLGLLAQHWDGRFATLWQAPAGYRAGDTVGDDGPVSAWLRERLDKVEVAPSTGRSATLAQRIFAFQLAQGLAPDGVAGPLTLMQLNRASGLEEPRLNAAR